MDAERLFSICSSVVLPGWLLLIVLPRWKWTVRLIASVLLPSLLGLVYIYLFATNIGNADGGFGSLAAVAKLFENENILLAGWIHYLAFDLFVGCWEVRDAQRTGVHHLLVIPCLVLTFMLGPTGLVLYFIIRAATTRKILVGVEAVAVVEA